MADFHRSALAVWSGSLKTGEGRASVESGLLRDAPVTFVSRFEQGRGTNPEELVAAAHASCFSMALSAGLSQAGTPPEEIRTRATVTLRMAAEGPKVVAVHLDVTGRVPGIDTDAFQEAADGAKSNCPISRLLAPGLESLSMEARLEG